MFSWLLPSCPVEFNHKVWIEYRLRYLSTKMGIQRIKVGDVLIPNAESIPELAPGRIPDVESLSQRLCDRLKIDRQGLTINVVEELPVDSAWGVYRTETREVLLHESLLSNPLQLLATLIHELLHDLLLHGGVLTGEESDHEQMTDLSACLFGCGIPLANATLRYHEFYPEGGGLGPEWTLGQSGYLSSPEFGYALAACCWIEGMPDPPTWSQYLRPDAEEPLRQGMRFLSQTGDTLFRRNSEGQIYTPTESDLLREVTEGSASEIMGALWDFPPTATLIPIDRLCQLTTHTEPLIRVNACGHLSERTGNDGSKDALFVASRDQEFGVRAASAYYYLKQYPVDQHATQVAVDALHDNSSTVVRSALAGLSGTPLWNEAIETSAMHVLSNSLLKNRSIEPEEVLRLLVEKSQGLKLKLRVRYSDPNYRMELAIALQTVRQMMAENSTARPTETGEGEVDST